MRPADIIKPCPYAMRDAIYQDCPRDVHGLKGERCVDCPQRPGTVNYWRETYVKRTAEARRYHGALIAIGEQVRAIEALPWWRRRKRRLHELAIRDTLTIALDEGMVTRGSRVG